MHYIVLYSLGSPVEINWVEPLLPRLAIVSYTAYVTWNDNIKSTRAKVSKTAAIQTRPGSSMKALDRETLDADYLDCLEWCIMYD
ncbi:hypothetical protein VKT23_002128 [Stygiomarasmius scandens]|uniref:Uncharacterized protein n=1 Tax=Marasmiellus scandens TaxID=2682957 RepID=A0ABR1K2Z2_9AGAR